MIYIVTHKPYEMPSEEGYIPLLVGAGKFSDYSQFPGYLRDNEGTQISEKNKNYCELTGLYWIWKNRTDDVVGLVHYRRFFKTASGLVSMKEVGKILEDSDLIMPKKRHYYIETVYSHYSHAHHPEDLECARAVIESLSPDYLEDFDAVMNQRTLRLYNMFISKKSVMDRYCQWLFSVLFEMEKKLDISSYSDNDKRVFGFVSERLFNVWVRHERLRVHELGVLNKESQHWGKKILNFIKRKAGYKG